MFNIWRYLWPFTPHAQGFHDLGAKLVTRHCKKWARIPLKYKQVVVMTEQGPDTRKIVDEWQLKCLEWEYVTIKSKPGMRKEYDFPMPDLRPREFKSESKTESPIYRAKQPKVSYTREKKYPEFVYTSKKPIEGLCGCRSWRKW